MHRFAGNSIYKTIVVVWLTLSIGSLLLAGYNWYQLNKKFEHINYLITVRATAITILISMLDNETATRGFVLTGTKSFLEPYDRSIKQINTLLETLLDTTQHDSVLIEKVFDLRSKVDLLLSHHKKIVEFRRSGDVILAQNMIKGGEGKKYMDDIRNLCEQIYIDRQTMLTQFSSIKNSQIARASLTSLIAGILGVGAGAFAFYLSHLTILHQIREKELVDAKLQAERNNEEKSLFLANMSHEIRTPMNAILGFCELLIGEIKEPKHIHYLKAIYSSGRSLLQLINDILDMSKIEAGVMELSQEPTDPREICQFVKTVFTEPATRKGVKLEFVISEELPHAIIFDRVRLRQILVNLVGNAVKFTDHGEISVRITFEKEPSHSQITLIIEVQDTGVGIPKEKLDKIFLPFVQAGTHKDKEKKGTGLGLSIVKRLVDLMGGSVTVASILNQGSAFSLRFPHVTISARIPQSEKHNLDYPVDFNFLKPSIIVVLDDNLANTELITGMFSKSHHRLEIFHSGADALKHLEVLRPDVILLDIRMPEMDGDKVLDIIRSTPGLELTPAIAVTASTLLREEDSLKNRFNGYVRKPFSSQELFNELSLFIPLYEPGKENALNSKTTPSSSSSPELLTELQQIHDEEWKDLQKSQGMNETKVFAEQLITIAKKYQSTHLERYANKLKIDADHFNANEVEELLSEFPELMRLLSENTTS